MSNVSRPGEWPHVGPKEYRRLVRLAKRKLAGNDHLAEDVVQLAMIKWTTIPSDKERARIEQVVKSEAISALRSELRARERDTRASCDPSLSKVEHNLGQEERDLRLLRTALAQAAAREASPVNSADVEILELLFAGSTITETVRLTGLSRSAVRRSRRMWQRIARRVLYDEQAST